jgi:hypothetical protein
MAAMEALMHDYDEDLDDKHGQHQDGPVVETKSTSPSM